jgi:hypothetical protein
MYATPARNKDTQMNLLLYVAPYQMVSVTKTSATDVPKYHRLVNTSNANLVPHQLNASSTKSTEPWYCLFRTALLTSSLNGPGPQTITPILPI